MELKDVEYIVACGSINVAVHGIHSMELKVFDSPKVSDTTSVSTWIHSMELKELEFPMSWNPSLEIS